MYKIIGSDQKQYGPVSADELRRWITEGRINGQSLIQLEGQADWRPLSSFPEFATMPQPLPSGVPVTPAPTGNAAALVSGPATALMIVGILCVLASIWGVVQNIFGIGYGDFGPGGAGNPDIPPQVAKWMQLMAGGVGLSINVIGIAISAFFIFASTKMRKLESYGLVMTATILSMIPCICPSCCCVIGLPVGIWILVVLAKPEVKSAFH